jgi:hypothetical protein
VYVHLDNNETTAAVDPLFVVFEVEKTAAQTNAERCSSGSYLLTSPREQIVRVFQISQINVLLHTWPFLGEPSKIIEVVKLPS